ncbi:MAG: sugar phosphate isomerase/epimerase [Clostridia bacterium]|nr:sugar phosphate isomerase/epimerase [Clostridia bacterium]
MKIGVQFYTIRDFCTTTDDLAESLKRVADIGYTTVQISGTCAFDAVWMDEQLKKNGLTCGITHNPYNRIIQETDTVIAEHNTFGCDHIGIGGYSCTPEAMAKFVEEAVPAAKKIRDAGKLFMYHNHHYEYLNKWEDGRTIMEYLAEKFDSSIMGFTLDTYWVKYAGYEPLEEIKRLKGRLPCVHFKDMFDDGNDRKMSWVGGGNTLNFEKIAAAFIDAGAGYAYVEQDDCYGEDPFDCLKKSYDYLRSIGLD